MDLIIKYIILLLLCFSFNIGLFSNPSYKNYRKYLPSIYSVLLFLVSIFAIYFSGCFSVINKYFNYYLMIFALILIVMAYLYENRKNLRDVLVFIFLILSALLILTLISLLDPDNIVLYGVSYPLLIIVLICIFVFIFSSIIKRIGGNIIQYFNYNNIVGEYMIVESIFIFLLGLTYDSVKSLDYTLFNSFLILSPSYQVISIIIILIIIILAGIFMGDEFNKK